MAENQRLGVREERGKDESEDPESNQVRGEIKVNVACWLRVWWERINMGQETS